MEGQENGGEEKERRRTIKLLMRPFWGAYVGHGMNEETFTTRRLMIYTRRHTRRCVALFMFAHFHRLHTGSHISLLNRHTRLDRATLSCVHFLCLSISLIYGCGPNAPSL